jgi:hypothetical protein
VTYPSAYVTPNDLLEASLPVNWGAQGPTNAQSNAQLARLSEVCEIATTDVNNTTSMNLRATVDTETLLGPGHRIGILPNGWARFVASMFPILKVVQVQTACGPPPFTWTTLPAGSAFPEQQPFSVYGSGSPGGSTGGQNAIYIAGCWVGWGNGRMGTWVAATYVNGWPHAGLAAAAPAGSLTLSVDDVTGWYNSVFVNPVTGLTGLGASGRIWDGASSEVVEVVSVAATNAAGQLEPSGPGTLTLAAPTVYAHTPASSGGPLISALPPTVRDAALLFAAAQGLRKGLGAITVPSLSGTSAGSGGGAEAAIEFLLHEATVKLASFHRVY